MRAYIYGLGSFLVDIIAHSLLSVVSPQELVHYSYREPKRNELTGRYPDPDESINEINKVEPVRWLLAN